MPNDDPYHELARRLCAALVSYQLRLASVDYALKKYVPSPIPPFWDELARDLAKQVDDMLTEKLLRPAARRRPPSEQ